MSTRGRKKKKNVSLFDTTTPLELQQDEFVDYSDISVSEQSLIWEYKNAQTKEAEIFTFPLSRNAAIKYWRNQVKLDDNQNAKSILNRILNDSHTLDKERQIYDKFPQQKFLIDQLLHSASTLCIIKNSAKRTGSFYASAITALINFFTSSFENISTLEEIDDHKQTILFNELSKTDSKYFYTSVKTFVKNILIYALEQNHISVDILKRTIKRNSHSGTKTRIDYSQEVAVQLLAISVSEISSTIRKYKEYEAWKKIYDGKPFDSIENIAKAYISIPENFLKKKNAGGRESAICAYQKSYDELCIKIHGVALSQMDTMQLIALAENGHNIDALDDSFTMAWFLDDIQCNFPFRVSSKSTADIPMSEYTRWDLKMSLRHFLNDRGSRRKKDFWGTYQDVFSRKYPTGDQLIPFVLFWMLQTGSNPEAIVNMKRKEKGIHGVFEIGELSPLGDTPVIRSYKNRGTKNWYWFALNQNEKGGLYSHFMFLKSFLSLLWMEDDKISNQKENWPFWVYYSPLRAKKVVHLSWANLKFQLNSFIKAHKIILPNGKVLKSLEPSRLRNTFITMADLGGSSIEEIQEWIKHDNFDTRFKFYNNSPDQRSRNFRAINAIQENIIEEARNFQGETEYGSLNASIENKSVTPTLMCGCNDPKHPSYAGAKEIPSEHICVDWDMCLFCPNSRVFVEHLPRICARILQYETYQKKMTTDEWENNFGTKHVVAKNALKRWLDNGGDQEDIDNAWELAKSGDILLPPIFPSGHMKVSQGTINAA